jgi:hypothetical protein
LLPGTQIAVYATYFYTTSIRQKIEIKQFVAKIGLVPNYAKTLKSASEV